MKNLFIIRSISIKQPLIIFRRNFKKINIFHNRQNIINSHNLEKVEPNKILVRKNFKFSKFQPYYNSNLQEIF